MLDFHPYFDIRHNWDGRVVNPTGRNWVDPRATECRQNE